MRRISLLSLPLGTRFLQRLTAAKCQHTPRSASTRFLRPRSAGTRGGRSLTLQLLAVIAAVAGSQLLTTQSGAQSPDLYGVFLLLAGFALWLLAEIVLDGQAARSWLRLRRLGARDGWAETAHFPRRQPRRAPLDLRAYQLRFLAALLGLAGSYLTYQFTANNHFSLVGFWSWVASIALWVCALAPQDWLEERVDQARAFSWRDRESQFRLLAALLGLMGGILTVRGIGSWVTLVSIALWVYAMLPRTGLRWIADRAGAIPWRDPTLWLLLGITLLAAVIRLNDLPAVPPEMNSDHVETVLDGYRTAAGERNIFFANNGGRVPFHFYAQALLAQLPGLGHNLITIKLLTVLEGLLAIPCLYWMGCVAVGGRPPGLGRVVGLLLAALVAVSYWHIFLSRAGLRWAPTVVVSALLLGLLARALRENRRGDYVKAGLVLGFGLYTYPSVRMLPLLALFGVAQAFIFWARDWRARFRYLWHLVVMALVAFVVFMPLYRYSNDDSNSFMARTRTRILGDNIVMDSPLEVIEALIVHFPDLLLNLRDSLLMYNWRGDSNWFHGAPGKPVLDPWAGAFFVLGLAAWSARLLRRRDVFDWALPVALLITLLPAALAIAFPIEIPGNTRSSASLPIAFLIAALPLGILLQAFWEQWRDGRTWLASAALLLLVLAGGYRVAHQRYFVLHLDAYLPSSKPHSEAGRVLRELGEAHGFGNVFIFGYPHWWDYRALGIEAGEPTWPNIIDPLERLENRLRDGALRANQFQLDPMQELVFFVHPDDAKGEAALREFFPNGILSEVLETYQAGDDYHLYRAPAADVGAFLERKRAG